MIAHGVRRKTRADTKTSQITSTKPLNNKAMAKCLRCGAGNEWISGSVKREPDETAQLREENERLRGMMSKYAPYKELCGELAELLRELDRSFYIGDDLKDGEILQWYLDVMKVAKEEISEALNKFDNLIRNDDGKEVS